MAYLSLPLKNLHKLSSRLSATVHVTTSASNPSPVTFPVRCFSTNSHGSVFTQFTSFPSNLFFTRCFNSHASPTDGDDSSVPGRRPGPYPFQETGARTVFEAKPVSGGLFVRMDMPGVGDDEVQIFVRDITLFFRGEARKEAKNYNFDSPRTYLGSLDLCSPSFQIGDIKSEMKNGVLRMFVQSLNK